MDLNQDIAEVIKLNDEAIQFLEDHPEPLKVEDILEQDEEYDDLYFDFYRNVNLTQKLHENGDGTGLFRTLERAAA